jgi:hypothetical protein
MSEAKIKQYKESGAIRRCIGDCIAYNGDKIWYDDYQILKFEHSMGEELVEENGELVRGEMCGFLKIEICTNEQNKERPKFFGLQLSTQSGDIIEMTFMDIRILKKLNHFLTYALENTNER